MNAASEDHYARAALSRLAEPATELVGRLVHQRGAAAVLDHIRSGDLPGHEAVLAGLRTRLPALDVDRDLATLRALGGRLVCPGDHEWPVALDDLGYAAPYALWVRGPGHLGTVVERSVAIVGTRACSDYGEHVATGMAADLADREWAVVSGGAYGIDACAHRGALAVGGATVAVLACGVDVTYPRGHRSLFAHLLEAGGLLVSELSPGSAPHRMRFLTRNRLIAALAAGTVVVEAAVRSGTRRTARYTRDLGRPLMVVPGPVTSATSAGCHELLRDDEPATLVTTAAHVLELVGRIGEDLAPVLRGPVSPRDGLPADAARVLDAMPVLRAQGPARIAETAGVPLGAVEQALGMLALLGLVEERETGWRLSADARASATGAPP